MADTNRCNGMKADGTRCGMTRMTNWAGRASHLTTPAPWFCSRHRDQDSGAPAINPDVNARIVERLRAGVDQG